ncbi:MAG: DUF4446 family protein [Candidatus Latescibacteria bacterium]|nr:DUF4446 family protein [bacterium]MBD3423366.1 DUF4446 family protein [Candidatus Latescibacterota bacterium]
MNELVSSNAALLISATFILAAAALVIAIILIYRLNRLSKPFAAMAEMYDNAGTRESLSRLLEGVDENREFLKKQSDRISAITEALNDFYCGMGLIRYNAFDDIGGNQSYSLCLLTPGRDGFILSSLVARNSARGYSIEVNNGAPSRELSDEEGQALQEAINSLKN